MCLQISLISVTYFDPDIHSFSAPNEYYDARVKLSSYLSCSPLRYGKLLP